MAKEEEVYYVSFVQCFLFTVCKHDAGEVLLLPCSFIGKAITLSPPLLVHFIKLSLFSSFSFIFIFFLLSSSPSLLSLSLLSLSLSSSLFNCCLFSVALFNFSSFLLVLSLSYLSLERSQSPPSPNYLILPVHSNTPIPFFCSFPFSSFFSLSTPYCVPSVHHPSLSSSRFIYVTISFVFSKVTFSFLCLSLSVCLSVSLSLSL
ncbi:unnamed protein product [Acanthosepion pharaonis]|uniref:Uncharacterized protein n=1 Tax=Acanthosepion pharaonis TaxID=158019 RepID=A0A812AKU7_ACAPH|nr:unnamed protein product [Sepia pharaonis]